MGLYAGKSRAWSAGAAAAVALVLLVATPSAGLATPAVPAGPDAAAARAAAVARAAGPPGELARLESRATAMARRYRGELVLLNDARSAAAVSAARAAQLRRQLGTARREMAWLAAVRYMSGGQDPLAAVFGGGDPRRLLAAAATAEYVTRQRSLKEQSLQRFLAREGRARQAAQARAGQLRRLVGALEGQRRRVAALLARFRPQSPVIGASITPRMLAVKNAVDGRFGPFGAIGCWRPEASGEHPLGRACDFMLSSGGAVPAPADVQRGYAIAAWAQANAARLGIMYIIYRQRIWDIRMPSAGWVPMADRGSITANHYDHVHISVF